MARADLRGPEFKDEKIEQAGPHCELAKAGRLPGKVEPKRKAFLEGKLHVPAGVAEEEQETRPAPPPGPSRAVRGGYLIGP